MVVKAMASVRIEICISDLMTELSVSPQCSPERIIIRTFMNLHMQL